MDAAWNAIATVIEWCILGLSWLVVAFFVGALLVLVWAGVSWVWKDLTGGQK